MRALTISEDRGLAVVERPDPEPELGQVRVRVAGAGLNRADLLQRAGLYPPPPGCPADIPGLEFAGTIDAIGPGVDRLASGDRVFGITGGGAQAELLVVDAEHCAPVPEALDLVAAGAVPEAFVTAHDAVFTRARLGPGETMLVHAVGSGVGTAALQLARAAGGRVSGTARSDWKLERAAELGLDQAALVPRDADAAAIVEALQDTVAPDVVLDLLGGEYLSASVSFAAERARIVLVGALAGASAQLSILATMSKRLELHGTVLRGRDRTGKATAMAAFEHHVGPLLASGVVEPIVEDVVALADAPDAYERMGSDELFGKLVLAP